MCLRFVCLVLLLAAAPAFSHTWLVEKSGSGDFEVIQDAVDASATGDTIRIGSGQFDDWEPYFDTYVRNVRILVESKDLSFIGEEDGSTVVGPDSAWNQGDPESIGMLVLSESEIIVKNIHFRNLRNGYITWAGAVSLISNCQFSTNRSSAFFFGGQNHVGYSQVSGCTFRGGSPVKTLHITAAYQDSIRVDGCTFEFAPSSPLNQGVFMSGGRSLIANSRFVGANSCIQVDRGASVTVRNCEFTDNGTCHVVASGGVGIEILDCTMTGQDRVFAAAGNEPYSFIMERSVVSDVHDAAIVAYKLEHGHVWDSILSGGDKGVVLFINHQYDPVQPVTQELTTSVFDMRDNYWGTDDPDSIQVLIDDSHDDPECPYTILWEPYKTEPVAAEKTPLGGLKSMFR